MSQSTTKRTFELISDEVPAAPVLPQTAPQLGEQTADQTHAARQLLFTALRALSQRATTAITNLFTLFLVTLNFVLLGRILDDPSYNRLAAVGGFAVFSLLIDIVRRRSK